MCLFSFLIAYLFSSQTQQKPTAVINENSFRSATTFQVNNETKNIMSENENREHVLGKRETKRPSNSLYKTLNSTEFLNKTQAEIRQEYRKMPNPSAKDTHAAK